LCPVSSCIFPTSRVNQKSGFYTPPARTSVCCDTKQPHLKKRLPDPRATPSSKRPRATIRLRPGSQRSATKRCGLALAARRLTMEENRAVPRVIVVGGGDSPNDDRSPLPLPRTSCVNTKRPKPRRLSLSFFLESIAILGAVASRVAPLGSYAGRRRPPGRSIYPPAGSLRRAGVPATPRRFLFGKPLGRSERGLFQPLLVVTLEVYLPLLST
jgi:hypothetical protein